MCKNQETENLQHAPLDRIVRERFSLHRGDHIITRGILENSFQAIRKRN